MTYSISKERCREFGTLFLLERMVNKPCNFPLLLEGDDVHLEDLLTFMVSRDYLGIKDDQWYVPTTKGRDVVVRFTRRYQDFLKNFDCYCAVDLAEGEFAFEQFWEIEDEDEWESFLNEERWEDLRIAVAKFKGIDPLEIVFYAMINEGRINDSEEGWQFDLVLGTIWDEIIEICNTALTMDDLAYEDEDGNPITGEEVLKDILRQGGELNLELKKQEEEYGEDDDDDEERPSGDYVVEEVVTEVIEDDVYYGYYHDPFYISPVWLAILLL